MCHMCTYYDSRIKLTSSKCPCFVLCQFNTPFSVICPDLDWTVFFRLLQTTKMLHLTDNAINPSFIFLQCSLPNKWCPFSEQPHTKLFPFILPDPQFLCCVETSKDSSSLPAGQTWIYILQGTFFFISLWKLIILVCEDNMDDQEEDGWREQVISWRDVWQYSKPQPTL